MSARGIHPNMGMDRTPNLQIQKSGDCINRVIKKKQFRLGRN